MKFPHDHARAHVTGQAIYIDDRRASGDEVLVEVVGAPVRSGRINKIDFSQALQVPGVIACFSAQDLAHNRFGNIVEDQPLLVEKEIGYIDEPVLLLAGTCARSLKQAKKLITFDIEPTPAITSLEQAIAEKKSLYRATPLARGDVEKALKNSPQTLQGSFFSGGQEHFYLENQAAIAYPLEDGQIEVHSSSQHPTETQHVVAHAIGVAYKDVVCVVKRMGGGFGGKESQAAPFAAYAALVAKHLKRPARLVLTKDDDMMITGKRHPMKSFYHVGFDHHGKIQALKIKFYADAGAYTDLSPSILDRTLFHGDSCYYLENVLFEGEAMKTNTHSNTAFRGFGGPQGSLVMEVIIDEIAHALNLDPFDVREKNLYQTSQGHRTPYNQELKDVLLPEIFSTLRKSSDYERRKKEIADFNQTNKFKHRALGVCGVKFGIAFTARFLNQGNALVNLHLDGTVQVSTGGTEMGQGLNIKIAQVAAHSLGLGPDKVMVMPTSTEKNHNTSPTAASSGSDLNAKATAMACDKIKRRLAWVADHVLKDKIPQGTGEIELPPDHFLADDFLFLNEEVIHKQSQKKVSLHKLIELAYFHRLSMGDYAFYKTPDLNYDKKTGKGDAFAYFTLGAGVTEVEVDRLTGEYKILRADLLMDLGTSINSGIDLGQVAGAYVQGVGWLTSESLFYAENGKLLSHSPTTYKIPNIQDTPREFNINLIANQNNKKNIMGSKAVGEPPFLLGISAFLALKSAAQSFCSKSVALNSPATPEKIYWAIHGS